MRKLVTVMTTSTTKLTAAHTALITMESNQLPSVSTLDGLQSFASGCSACIGCLSTMYLLFFFDASLASPPAQTFPWTTFLPGDSVKEIKTPNRIKRSIACRFLEDHDQS